MAHSHKRRFFLHQELYSISQSSIIQAGSSPALNQLLLAHKYAHHVAIAGRVFPSTNSPQLCSVGILHIPVSLMLSTLSLSGFVDHFLHQNVVFLPVFSLSREQGLQVLQFCTVVRQSFTKIMTISHDSTLCRNKILTSQTLQTGTRDSRTAFGKLWKHTQ